MKPVTFFKHSFKKIRPLLSPLSFFLLIVAAFIIAVLYLSVLFKIQWLSVVCGLGLYCVLWGFLSYYGCLPAGPSNGQTASQTEPEHLRTISTVVTSCQSSFQSDTANVARYYVNTRMGNAAGANEHCTSLPRRHAPVTMPMPCVELSPVERLQLGHRPRVHNPTGSSSLHQLNAANGTASEQQSSCENNHFPNYEDPPPSYEALPSYEDVTGSKNIRTELLAEC